MISNQIIFMTLISILMNDYKIIEGAHIITKNNINNNQQRFHPVLYPQQQHKPEIRITM